MFAARQQVQRAARTLANHARRIHAAANTTHKASSRVSRLALLASGAVCVGAAYSVLRPSQAQCQQQTTPSLAQQSAAASVAAPDTVRYYTPTRSQLASLPQSADEIAKLSHDEISALFDPERSGELGHPLAHTLAMGGPSDASSLEPLELLFTAADEDPVHRHLELIVRSAQNRICNALLDCEQMSTATLQELNGMPLNDEARMHVLNQGSQPGQFCEHVVLREDGSGGGIERVLNGGRVFAKAGVNVSVTSRSAAHPALYDRLLPDHPSLLAVDKPKEPFKLWTASISLVLHPVSPHVPTSHANYRYFQLDFANGKRVWWFGGGADLTPTYVEDDDARFFHRSIKSMLDPFNPSYYPEWKKWCDQYFKVKHRNETRGVGGVFFDDLHKAPREHYEGMMHRMAEGFAAQYFPIVVKKKDQPFDESDLAFQQLRRGRYVEFNLLYDKGTSYGLLMPNARVDAILMSLPPICRFEYKQQFEGDKQRKTHDILTNPIDW